MTLARLSEAVTRARSHSCPCFGAARGRRWSVVRRGRRGAMQRAGTVASLVLLCGCIISTASVRAPAPPSAESLQPLGRTVTFDVCPPRRGRAAATELGRREPAYRIARALERVGIEASLVPTPGSPARFTVTELEESKHDWSMVLSLLTFSIVPGYFVERDTLDVDIASPAAPNVVEHLRYQRQVSYFAWAPLIVHPDYVGTVVAAWMSAEAEDGGAENMMLRFAADLRDRVALDGPDVAWSEAYGVACSGRAGRR